MANNRRVRSRNIPKTEKAIEEKIPEPVKIDFSKAIERSSYIKEKLDDILENIGESYGKRLTDELIKRLKETVKGFHVEVSEMLDKLHQIEEKRKIKEKETEVIAGEEGTLPEDFENLSEVEKRLKIREIEKEKKSDTESSDDKSKVSKKKGIFKKKEKK